MTQPPDKREIFASAPSAVALSLFLNRLARTVLRTVLGPTQPQPSARLVNRPQPPEANPLLPLRFFQLADDADDADGRISLSGVYVGDVRATRFAFGSRSGQ